MGLKVKVGRGDLAADLATIRAVREASGAQTALLVDYNQSLSVPEAIAWVRVLDDEGLYWIEEPTRADDFAGHARIAQAARTAIQLGENWWGPPDVALSAQLLRVTPTGHWLEYLDHAGPILMDPVRIRDGQAWNEAAVRQARAL